MSRIKEEQLCDKSKKFLPSAQIQLQSTLCSVTKQDWELSYTINWILRWDAQSKGSNQTTEKRLKDFVDERISEKIQLQDEEIQTEKEALITSIFYK